MTGSLLHSNNDAHDRIEPTVNAAIEIAGASYGIRVAKRIPVNVHICIGVGCSCTGSTGSSETAGISRNASNAWRTAARDQLIVRFGS